MVDDPGAVRPATPVGDAEQGLLRAERRRRVLADLELAHRVRGGTASGRARRRREELAHRMSRLSF